VEREVVTSSFVLVDLVVIILELISNNFQKFFYYNNYCDILNNLINTFYIFDFYQNQGVTLQITPFPLPANFAKKKGMGSVIGSEKYRKILH
jgi:hypothetical protein